MKQGDLVRNIRTGRLGILASNLRNVKDMNDDPPKEHRSEMKDGSELVLSMKFEAVNDFFYFNVLTDGELRDWVPSEIELIQEA